MALVLKFGGTSVADGKRIKNVAEYINELKKENDVVVVTSAMSKVTDFLEEIAIEMKNCDKDPDNIVKKYITELKEKHLKALEIAVSNKEIQKSIIKKIDSTLKELKNALRGIAYLGELTARSMDLISSFGERLVVPILSGAISELGNASEHLTGGEAGIVTCKTHGSAIPNKSILNQRCKSKIEELLSEGKVPVITGFIAESEDGVITTLGRGGSDYSASLIGAAIGADEIWIMTDVDGILTADPKLVKDARTIPILSYNEALEIAYFGAKVIHPKTIEPAMVADVPVRIKNTFNPEKEGTLVVHKEIQEKNAVKCISTLNNVAIVTVSGAGMIGLYDVAGKVFSALGQKKIHIIAISQSSSESNITFVVDREDLDRSLSVLRSEFPDTSIVRDISVDGDVSLIAVVGAGMKGIPGVAARVFNSVSRVKSNILMIAQGSSELNITFGLSEKDLNSATQALHDEFKLA